MLSDFERADRIGLYYANPKTHTFAELLIEATRTGRSGRCWSACCGNATTDGRATGSPRRMMGPYI